jgi:hypothetical protein
MPEQVWLARSRYLLVPGRICGKEAPNGIERYGVR